MDIVPDAPWVRNAMMFGIVDPPEVRCPVCGEEAENLYVDKHSGDILGCERCIELVNAYDEMEKHKS